MTSYENGQSTWDISQEKRCVKPQVYEFKIKISDHQRNIN